MEVHFSPDQQERLQRRAAQQGCNPDEVVRDVVARYFEEEVSVKEQTVEISRIFHGAQDWP